jgi:hypothetical protein
LGEEGLRTRGRAARRDRRQPATMTRAVATPRHRFASSAPALPVIEHAPDVVFLRLGGLLGSPLDLSRSRRRVPSVWSRKCNADFQLSLTGQTTRRIPASQAISSTIATVVAIAVTPYLCSRSIAPTTHATIPSSESPMLGKSEAQSPIASSATAAPPVPTADVVEGGREDRLRGQHKRGCPQPRARTRAQRARRAQIPAQLGAGRPAPTDHVAGDAEE